MSNNIKPRPIVSGDFNIWAIYRRPSCYLFVVLYIIGLGLFCQSSAQAARPKGSIVRQDQSAQPAVSCTVQQGSIKTGKKATVSVTLQAGAAKIKKGDYYINVRRSSGVPPTEAMLLMEPLSSLKAQTKTTKKYTIDPFININIDTQSIGKPLKIDVFMTAAAGGLKTPCTDGAAQYTVSNVKMYPTKPETIDTVAPPVPVGDDKLDNWIQAHTRYDGGSAMSYRSDFKKFVELMGGDMFIDKLGFIYPNNMLDINGLQSNYAQYSPYSQLVEYGKNNWDNNPSRRVAVLIHEYVHFLESYDYYSTPNYRAQTEALFNEIKNNPSRQWDAQAMSSPPELIACGVEWIITNERYDGTETKRERLKRIDPILYDYLVTNFIPKIRAPLPI